jgi:hypothetical protein
VLFSEPMDSLSEMAYVEPLGRAWRKGVDALNSKQMEKLTNRASLRLILLGSHDGEGRSDYIERPLHRHY